MKTKKVKYLISKKLQKEYNKIIKDNGLNKSYVIEELIRNYIDQNKPVSKLILPLPTPPLNRLLKEVNEPPKPNLLS